MILEFYKDKAGETRWRLRADNNQIIAESGEGYKNPDDAEGGWDLVVDAAEAMCKECGPSGNCVSSTLEIVHPCTVHPDDTVCEASGRAGCHA